MTEHDPATLSALEDLESWLPKLIEKHMISGDLQEGAFFSEFAGIADVIVASAPAEQRGWADGRVQCMLKNAELIPGEDEGEPCA